MHHTSSDLDTSAWNLSCDNASSAKLVGTSRWMSRRFALRRFVWLGGFCLAWFFLCATVPTRHKELTGGVVALPDGVRSVAAPQGFIAEHPDTAGCVDSNEDIQAAAVVSIQNASDEPMDIWATSVTLQTTDGFFSTDSPDVILAARVNGDARPFPIVLRKDDTLDLSMRSLPFGFADNLTNIDQMTVTVPTSRGDFIASFGSITAVPVIDP